VRCYDVACVDLTETPTLVTSMTGTGTAMATALLDDRLFFTRDGLAQVSVYNTISLQPTRTITYSGFGTQLYVLATSAISNYLYITDFGNRQVHRVGLSVTSTVSVVTWSVLPLPYGISVTSANNVLVSMSSNIINEYTPSGSLVRTIATTGTPYQAVQVNTNVWAFTQFVPVSQICTVL